MLSNQYQQYFNKYTDIYNNTLSTYNLLSYAKLLLFFLAIIFIYAAISSDFSSTFSLLASLLTCSFFGLWYYHHRLQVLLKKAKSMSSIYQAYLDRLSGNWSSFPDTADSHLDYHHPYAFDLDIVGKNSLFQLLNICQTYYGREQFLQDLLHSSYSDSDILSRQSAIQELSLDNDFVISWQYTSFGLNCNPNIYNLVTHIEKTKFTIFSNWLKSIFIFLPICSLTTLTISLLFSNKLFTILTLIFFLLQTCIWLLGSSYTHKHLDEASYNSDSLIKYSHLFSLVLNKNFNTPYLQNIQKSLSLSSPAIKHLSNLGKFFNLRTNALVYSFLNIFFLFDYHCLFSLSNWQKQYSHFLSQWFKNLGYLESLASFSILPHVCSETIIPKISSDPSLVLKSKNLGHPLISNSSRITNDVTLGQNVYLISGSNMSGKTTFLRTIGINFILGRAGSFVCAKDFCFTPLMVITSMRIRDDLSAGISTFYAELQRIKKIIDYARNHNDLLFLIDEIFRGTNSLDRLRGGELVIKKLLSFHTQGLLTTHDLELTSLADTVSGIYNYHFSEYYNSQNELNFSYKLQSGYATSSNAHYLMKLVGILD